MGRRHGASLPQLFGHGGWGDRPNAVGAYDSTPSCSRLCSEYLHSLCATQTPFSSINISYADQCNALLQLYTSYLSRDCLKTHLHIWAALILKPPPPTPKALYVLHASVRASVRPRLFPRYLQYLVMHFRQTFVVGASRDKDELIRFWGQRSRSRYRRGGVLHFLRL